MPPTFSHLMIKVKRIGWLTQVAMKKNNLEQLSQLAFDAQKNSHSPYSNFKVGAAVLTPSGETFSGCNVESAAFPLGQCAEATAIGNMVTQGHKTYFAYRYCEPERRVLLSVRWMQTENCWICPRWNSRNHGKSKWRDIRNHHWWVTSKCL